MEKLLSEQSLCLRYSESFKQKVVGEIECGKLNIQEARKLYDIRGGQTIQRWIKQRGKNHLLQKVVRIEMAEEKSKLKQQEQKIKELEKALVHAQLDLLKSESDLQAICEMLGIDKTEVLKKKQGKNRFP